MSSPEAGKLATCVSSQQYSVLILGFRLFNGGGGGVCDNDYVDADEKNDNDHIDCIQQPTNSPINRHTASLTPMLTHAFILLV